MNILVTGGAGFIGSNLVRFLLANRADWSITNIDALYSGGNPDNLRFEIFPNAKNYRFVHANICDRAVIDPLIKSSDMVVHLAAESHVDRSIHDAEPFLRSNVIGTQSVIDSLRAAQDRDGRCRRLLFVSTDEVYGSLSLDAPDQNFTEDSPLRPRNPYAASKAAADMLCHAAIHTHGMDIVIARCSNNFGPYQSPDKLIPRFITLLIEDKPVPLYGNGLQIREWLHVEDCTEALLAVLENARSGEVFNIGSNNESSNIDLTRELLRLLNKPESLIDYVEDRKGHDLRYALDVTKITETLDWKPSRSAWPDALETTVSWYLDHPDWCRNAIDRLKKPA